MVHLGGKLIVYGGHKCTLSGYDQGTNELWAFDLADNMWYSPFTSAQGESPLPFQLGAAAPVTEPRRAARRLVCVKRRPCAARALPLPFSLLAHDAESSTGVRDARASHLPPQLPSSDPRAGGGGRPNAAYVYVATCRLGSAPRKLFEQEQKQKEGVRY